MLHFYFTVSQLKSSYSLGGACYPGLPYTFLFVHVFVFLFFFDGLFCIAFGHFTAYSTGYALPPFNPLNWLITATEIKSVDRIREKKLRQIFFGCPHLFHANALLFFLLRRGRKHPQQAAQTEVVTPRSKLGEIDHARGDSERENQKTRATNS